MTTMHTYDHPDSHGYLGWIETPDTVIYVGLDGTLSFSPRLY